MSATPFRAAVPRRPAQPGPVPVAASAARTLPGHRRLALLAAAVQAPHWIVLPVDPGGDLAALAAGVASAPVLAATGGSAVAAIARLQARGLRARVHLVAAGGIEAARGWRDPVGLLALPAAQGSPRGLLAAWGPHVEAGGHVIFLDGAAPPPEALGLRPDYWHAHASREGVFLLTRRPFG